MRTHNERLNRLWEPAGRAIITPDSVEQSRRVNIATQDDGLIRPEAIQTLGLLALGILTYDTTRNTSSTTVYSQTDPMQGLVLGAGFWNIAVFVGCRMANSGAGNVDFRLTMDGIAATGVISRPAPTDVGPFFNAFLITNVEGGRAPEIRAQFKSNAGGTSTMSDVMGIGVALRP